MKRILVLCFWLLVAVQAFAEERVPLWPEGKIPDFQTSQIAATTQEVKAPGFKAGRPCDAVSRLVRGASREKRRMHVAHFRRRLSELLRWGVD